MAWSFAGPGSTLSYSQTSEYDEYVLPLAPLEGRPRAPAEVLNLEGKVTHLQYRVPGRSTLEVYRNYESALTQAGFEILFEHAGENFGYDHRHRRAHRRRDRRLSQR